MTVVRLAYGGPPQAIQKGLEGRERVPAILVSFFYLDGWLKNQNLYHYRNWALDSGAFSAYNSGAQINLNEFIDTSANLLETDSTLTEVFALDVIGDPKASIRNTEIMWKAGVEAIPTYHYGSPEDVLFHIAKNYPKIALGGVAGLVSHRERERWAKHCFSCVWPKKIHGFGYGGARALFRMPWHSVDASTWELGPCRFGRWNKYPGASVRGGTQNLRGEVEWYLELERQAKHRWAKTLKELK